MLSRAIDSEPILVETRQSVAIVTFNQPATRNSLSSSILTNLESILKVITHNRHLETIVFTGCDNVFLSGADIGELTALGQDDASDFANRGQWLFQQIADARQLTIAAINGHCMGGGLDFALACDVRIATPDSWFAHPGARLGIITGWGGTQRLPRLVGRTRALEILTTARRISSPEALAIGLIHRVDSAPVDCAMNLRA